MVTGKGADRVVGLVVVAMMIDVKRPARDEQGRPIRNHATMIAVPETAGYDLDQCKGKWYGPVPVPPLSDNVLISGATVIDLEDWRRFYPEEAI